MKMIWRYGAEEVIACVIRNAPKKWGQKEGVDSSEPIVPAEPLEYAEDMGL